MWIETLGRPVRTAQQPDNVADENPVVRRLGIGLLEQFRGEF